jgi:hypothetical protein
MATPAGIDTVVRQQVPIAATQATPILMLRIKTHPLVRQIVQVHMAGPCMYYTEHFHIYIIDSPTRHNVSHLDKRSSLVHYHRTIYIQASMYVTIRRGDLLRMRFFWLRFGAVRPGLVHVIGVQ